MSTFVTNRVVDSNLIGDQTILTSLSSTDEFLLRRVSTNTLRKTTLNTIMNFILAAMSGSSANLPYIRATEILSNGTLGTDALDIQRSLTNLDLTSNITEVSISGGGLILPSGTYRFRLVSCPMSSSKTDRIMRWSLEQSSSEIIRSTEFYSGGPIIFEGTFINSSSNPVTVRLKSTLLAAGPSTLVAQGTVPFVGTMLELWRLT